ncbi:hypothetical protein SPRG_21766 [Saprolegnia parasitica CBS 223.65]|uniref:beta-glucosidase n=1 Tax=Saprolegnia parasitica (strain CBS 223.65) TaxID=695850 RepID=A0A067BIU1_SAPPC|nr:hypothetical protein SPRG_21766 [Saprolegnia parasitica CBS 223.65]KDO18093.1 hypothetical protein SPRG_21766 [Saprolegnia parasitica CBS 223.65]|eukprot:XP_012211198.1 hypothetical protein SPRG_21766 [Saprolegnia parasitica CBS 223.65]
MTQLSINQVLNSDLTLNEAQVEAYAKLGIGSYLNSPFAGGPKNAKYGWNATEWRDILGRIQAIHRKIDRHPILFGLDSVHGANYVANAVLFPHQINAGASFNRRLVKELGFYTARDTAAAGIPWIFGPILDVASHKAWPRVYETFGEDPFLVTQMASQIVHANASIVSHGPAIDSIGHLCGGWSLAWQGNGGNDMFPHGQSVLAALKTAVYVPTDMAEATRLAGQAAYTLVVLGEGPYAEKPGDIHDLALPDGQVAYVRALAATKTKLLLVLVEGRPRLLQGLPDLASAVLHAMLPGEMGGAAIASVLLGARTPVAGCPVTYYHRRNAGCNTNGLFGECAPEWAFGSGLSYTRFTYSDVSVLVGEHHALTITLAVQNTGDRDGDHVVLLFLRQEARRGNAPETKRLVFFEKLAVAAGSAKVVRAELRAKDWGIYTNEVGHGLEKHVSPGAYTLLVSEAADCAKGQCVRFRAGVHGTYTPTTTVQVAAQSHVASVLRYHMSL